MPINRVLLIAAASWLGSFLPSQSIAQVPVTDQRISPLTAPDTLDATVNFNRGQSFISVGYGLLNIQQLVIISGYDNGSNSKRMLLGPLHAKYEYALDEHWGFGASFNYAQAKITRTKQASIQSPPYLLPYTQTTNWRSFSAIARVNYHFASSDRFDPYIGLGFGYRWAGITHKTSEEATFDYLADEVPPVNLIPIGFEATCGARFYITPKIAGYGELGLGKALLQFGITGKI